MSNEGIGSLVRPRDTYGDRAADSGDEGSTAAALLILKGVDPIRRSVRVRNGFLFFSH